MSENGWWLEVQVGSREAFIEVEEITVISYDDGTDGRGGKKLARAGEGVSLCIRRKEICRLSDGGECYGQK